ncbi:alpha/beta hydrolase fold domain-containing protein [Amycolatopsis sp. NPDC004747]
MLRKASTSSSAVRRLVFGPERDWIRHLGLYVAIADMPGETSPATIAYGPEPSQVGELYLPEGDGRFPVVAVFHSGYWSAMWDRRQITDVVDDLVGRGDAVWNVEYRRVGEPGGGWPGTFLDVAAAVDALDGMDPALDTGRVVLLGHSAGGHLATWAAHRGVLPPEAPGAHPKVTPVGVAEPAGALDLRAADAAGFGKVLADPEAEPPKDAPEPARPDVWPAVADAVVHPDHPVWPELTGWLHRIVTGQEG